MLSRKSIVKKKKPDGKLCDNKNNAGVRQKSNVSESGKNVKTMVGCNDEKNILEEESVEQTGNIYTTRLKVRNLEKLKDQTLNNETNDKSNNVLLHSPQQFLSLSKKGKALLSSPSKISEQENRIKIEICNNEITANSPSVLSPKTKVSNYSPRKQTKDSKRDMARKLNTPLLLRNEKEIWFTTNTSGLTPSKSKRIKFSDSSDYEQLCDNIKPEIYDHEHFNDLEPIELLHDIDSAINFTDTNISSDILLSSITYDNAAHNAEEDNFKISKDPPVDPLFIGNSDEQSTNVKTVKTLQLYSRTVKLKKGRNKARNPTVYAAKKNIKSTKSITKKRICYTNRKKQLRLSKENRGENKSQKSQVEKLYLENQSKLSTDIIDQLADLHINLIHDVPPQHEVESTGGCHAPTQAQKILFTKYGPLKKGTYSVSEDNIIKSNWEKFCKLHDWDPNEVQPFLYMRHNGKFYIKKIEERRKFVQFLANGLPWRTLYSVYYRFRNLYEQRTRHLGRDHNIRYSREEDLKILSYMEKESTENNVQNKMCSDLSKILGRTRQSIWLRYQKLKKNGYVKGKLNTSSKNTKEPRTVVNWTVLKIEKFIKALLHITLSEDIQELKDAILPKPIWQKMEEKLNIEQNVLKRFWLHQLHMQLFCTRSIYLNDIKIELIEYMYAKGISTVREIIWPNIANYFEGVPTIFLCKMFFNLVKECTTKTPIREFSDIIEHLYQNKISEIKSEVTDKFLPRLAYTNGKISIIDTDVNDYVDNE